MTAAPLSGNELPDELSRVHESKTRQCLRCRAQFESQWAGERICNRCKGTSSWRNGSSMPTISTSER